MADRFEGKVAIVTGAASGIGAASARRFAAEGARVMLSDINTSAGNALAAEIGTAAAFQSCDVAREAEMQSLVDATVARFGRLDILCNNAGIGSYGQTPDIDSQVWRSIIDIDLHSVFYGCRAAIPHLRRVGGGAIVNTASISGLFADYGLAAYNAAKGAVVNYTRSLAIDHAPENIRANAVCPGPIDTPLASPLIAHPGVYEDYCRMIPMGRVGRPEEVAAAITFLASDDASFITGAMLVIDGGVTAATGQPNFGRHFGKLSE